VRRRPAPIAEVKVAQAPFDTTKIIGIGASTGGTEAIYRVLKALPANIPGIAIVQHIPPVFSGMFAQRMNTQTALNVKEAENGDFLEPGSVLIAPGDKHMQLRRVGDRYKAEVFEGEKVSGHCPSVDVLFESMAKACGDRAVGVLLTGMGSDGARGLLSMRRSGAFTIGQDEKSCVVYGMPKIAHDLGGVEKQLNLDAIPGELVQHLSKR
jgi:two-component system chemotaxis response regulator CheB